MQENHEEKGEGHDDAEEEIESERYDKAEEEIESERIREDGEKRFRAREYSEQGKYRRGHHDKACIIHKYFLYPSISILFLLREYLIF